MRHHVFVVRCASAKNPQAHVGAARTFKGAAEEAEKNMSAEDWARVRATVVRVISDPKIEELKIPGILVIQRVGLRA